MFWFPFCISWHFLTSPSPTVSKEASAVEKTGDPSGVPREDGPVTPRPRQTQKTAAAQAKLEGNLFIYRPELSPL